MGQEPESITVGLISGYRQPFRQGFLTEMQSDGKQLSNNNSPPGKLYLDRDLTQTGLNAIHQDIDSSSLTDPSEHTSYSDLSHSTIHPTVYIVDGLAVRFESQATTGPIDTPGDRTTDSPIMADRCDEIRMEPTQIGPLLDISDPDGGGPMEDDVLQISGAGHWFLDGWNGDHAVEFLVDSGSSVTAMSDSLYQSLVCAGAPVGTLGRTSRTLRGANGTGIVVSGCSHCVVSFMGLLTEFLILVCELASGTDAIIGTDVLGSVLPHTLDMKNGALFHHTRRWYCIVLYVLLGDAGCPIVDFWRASLFLQKTRASSSEELWWTLPAGEFRYSCRILVIIRLW